VSLVVRPVRPEELPAVGRLTVDAYVADGIVPADHEYADQLRDAQARAAEASLLVAEDASGVVGTVTVAQHGSPWAEIATPHEAEIRMLAVHPAARGRGVGLLLVRAALDVARSTGAEAVALTTLSTMRVAHRIYEGLGFERAPERDWQHEEYVMLVYTLAMDPAA
jgi:ribosomal protein S18 acetylase RimI-like enzyme